MLILGKHLNSHKALHIALTQVFGINKTSALKLCGIVGISPEARLSQLHVQHYDKLSQICSEQIGGLLFRRALHNIKSLIAIKHYRGVRHMFGLPCRGQRTRTNAVTAKKINTKTLNLHAKKSTSSGSKSPHTKKK